MSCERVRVPVSVHVVFVWQGTMEEHFVYWMDFTLYRYIWNKKVKSKEHVSMPSYAKTFKSMQQNLMIKSVECFNLIYENPYTIIAFIQKSYNSICKLSYSQSCVGCLSKALLIVILYIYIYLISLKKFD